MRRVGSRRGDGRLGARPPRCPHDHGRGDKTSAHQAAPDKTLGHHAHSSMAGFEMKCRSAWVLIGCISIHRHVVVLQDSEDLAAPSLDHRVELGLAFVVMASNAHREVEREPHPRRGIGVGERDECERDGRPLRPVARSGPPHDRDVDRVLGDRVDDVLRVVRFRVRVEEVAEADQPHDPPNPERVNRRRIGIVVADDVHADSQVSE